MNAITPLGALHRDLGINRTARYIVPGKLANFSRRWAPLGAYLTVWATALLVTA